MDKMNKVIENNAIDFVIDTIKDIYNLWTRFIEYNEGFKSVITMETCVPEMSCVTEIENPLDVEINEKDNQIVVENGATEIIIPLSMPCLVHKVKILSQDAAKTTYCELKLEWEDYIVDFCYATMEDNLK